MPIPAGPLTTIALPRSSRASTRLWSAPISRARPRRTVATARSFLPSERSRRPCRSRALHKSVTSVSRPHDSAARAPHSPRRPQRPTGIDDETPERESAPLDRSSGYRNPIHNRTSTVSLGAGAELAGRSGSHLPSSARCSRSEGLYERRSPAGAPVAGCGRSVSRISPTGARLGARVARNAGPGHEPGRTRRETFCSPEAQSVAPAPERGRRPVTARLGIQGVCLAGGSGRVCCRAASSGPALFP